MKAYPECDGDRVKTCPDCNGDGVVDTDTDDERQCPTCGGLGFVPDDDDYEEVIKTSRVAAQRDQTSEAIHEKHSGRIAIDPADAERLRRRIAGRQRRREALA
jgi:DnaJ-class molecular chaperone